MLDIDISFINKCFICACDRLFSNAPKSITCGNKHQTFKVQNKVNQYQMQMKTLENWFKNKYLGIQ